AHRDRDAAQRAGRRPGRREAAEPLAEPQVFAVELIDTSHAHQLHAADDFRFEKGQSSLNAGLAGRSEGIEVEAPARDRLGAEAERLQHVTAAPYAAIQDHFDPIADCVDDLGKLVEGGAAAVELAPAVVGDHDRVAAHVGRAA